MHDALVPVSDGEMVMDDDGRSAGKEHYRTTGIVLLAMGIIGLIVGFVATQMGLRDVGFIDGPSATLISTGMMAVGGWMFYYSHKED